MPAPSAPRPTLVGGRFELGARIGQGGMGTVFRGRDTVTGEAVAIKRLRPEAALGDAAALQRFVREGEALRRLNHPNVVKLLEAVSEGDEHYLVMDFILGGSLESLLGPTSPALSIERVLAIALDLADALARAHRLNIIHRDLKPSNVLMADDGTPLLSDFGVAQIGGAERISGSNAVLGTLDYLSPEALQGEAIDARADLWAFGVLLFEMLSGRRPFAAGHAAGTLHAIMTAAPPDLEALRPECPTALVDLTYRLLDKDRNQRIPSARHLGVELERILQNPPVNPATDTSPRIEAAGLARTRVSPQEAPAGESPPLGKRLPAPATPFVGREVELAALAELMGDPLVRLVTIVGPGGMGKSRLALEAGRLFAERRGAFSETAVLATELQGVVVLVELAALAAAHLILPAIAEAVGFQFYPGGEPKPQLLACLAPRRLLLVLDNFEHLLEGASLVSDILQAAPGVKVLASSRERLGLSQENVFNLAGLSFPEAQSLHRACDFSGVQLFAQSARRVKPDFALTAEVTAAVARICGLVAGMPLGIVLAASWVNVLSPPEITHEIARGFEFLQAELRDMPERQHSMRAVFDHSWRLLGSEERRVFAALGVFRGGFTRLAAQAVTGASLRTLGALLNKSLILRNPESGRYSIHELLRQYAEAQLAHMPGEPARTLDEHARYHAAFLGQRQAALQGANPEQPATEIDAELDNIRAAWARMLERPDLERVSVAIEVLNLFYTQRAFWAEADTAFAATAHALLRNEPTPSAEHTRLAGLALSLQASALNAQQREGEAVAVAERALALLDQRTNPREAALALFARQLALFFDRVARAERGPGASPTGHLEAADRAIALLRSTGDHWSTAQALVRLGQFVEPFKAEAYYRESISLQLSFGDRTIVMPNALSGLGELKEQQGDRDEAYALMREALSVAERRGDLWSKVMTLERLCIVELKRSNLQEAEAYARRHLALCREFMPFAEPQSQLKLGEVLIARGEIDAAVPYFQRALDADALTAALAQLSLGDVDFRRGQYSSAVERMSKSLSYFEQTQLYWGIAIAADALGWVNRHTGDIDGARARFLRELEVALESSSWPWLSCALCGLASVLSCRGELERAAELAALVQRHPATEPALRHGRVEPLLAELRAGLTANAFAAASERGARLELQATALSILDSH